MLIRGIASLARWDGTTHVNRSDATTAGDVISDLRTRNNTLSVWCADSDEDINDAIVAMSLNRTGLSKIVALLIDEADLNAMQISCSDEIIGDAPGAIESIKKKHRDLLEIDYKRLGDLSGYMMKIVHVKGRLVERTKPSLKRLLDEYRNGNKIIPSDMNPELLKNLKW